MRVSEGLYNTGAMGAIVAYRSHKRRKVEFLDGVRHGWILAFCCALAIRQLFKTLFPTASLRIKGPVALTHNKTSFELLRKCWFWH